MQNNNQTPATWNRTRSIAELRSFVTSHEDALDVEDFDL